MDEKIVRYSKLREDWINCTRCKYCDNRKMVVLGAGPLDAQIMMIGQWPGRDEDIKGVPVQGEGGKWVQAALSAGNVPWEAVFFDNILGCKPTDKPKKSEKSVCRERLNETINIIQPKLIILAGAEASKEFYGKNIAGSKIAGTSWVTGEMTYFSTTHPVEPVHMKSPDAQRASWNRIALEYKTLGDLARGLCILPRLEE